MRVANCVHTSSVFAIYAAFFFEPGGRPGPRRCLRRRRPLFAFGTTTAALSCAAFSATALGGRPGAPGRHFPRRLRRRRLFAFVPVATLPHRHWIAEPAPCYTGPRSTVTKLL